MCNMCRFVPTIVIFARTCIIKYINLVYQGFLHVHVSEMIAIACTAHIHMDIYMYCI